MRESTIGQKLDHFVFDRLTRWLSPFKAPGSRAAYFEKLENDFAEDTGLLNLTFGLFSAIDTKTAALLTHISILIAAVAIFYANATPGTLYKLLLAAELVGYLVSTLLCLRCIRFSLPSTTTGANHKSEAYEEIVKRRAVLTLASDITIIATILLTILIVFHACFS